MTKEQISAYCVDHVAEILRIPKDSVDANANFARLGLDSAMSVYLVMELEEKLNLEIDSDTLVDYPTIDALSAFLAEKAGGAEARRAG
jgi:acyl carrier protein